MFKVLIYQFQEIFTTFILASLQKAGLNHISFLFSIFMIILLFFFFFINIIRYIFFLIRKLLLKTAIFKGIHIYLTTLLEYFLICWLISYSQIYRFWDLFNSGLRVIRVNINIWRVLISFYKRFESVIREV